MRVRARRDAARGGLDLYSHLERGVPRAHLHSVETLWKAIFGQISLRVLKVPRPPGPFALSLDRQGGVSSEIYGGLSPQNLPDRGGGCPVRFRRDFKGFCRFTVSRHF